MHTSTAFCHCDLDVLGERAYPPPMSPENMMACGELVDEDTLEKVSAK